MKDDGRTFRLDLDGYVILTTLDIGTMVGLRALADRDDDPMIRLMAQMEYNQRRKHGEA